jgi:uncharacterized 2Fe-2S/4Fe-4S cluster protein (DUF4445 family)
MPIKIKAKSSDLNSNYEMVVSPGLTLLEILQNQEVPIKSSCLGKGLCRQCRVRIETGFAPITDNDRKSFSKSLLDQGWRLSCGIRPKTPIDVFFPQSYSFQEKISIQRTPVSEYFMICDYGTTGVEIAAVDSNGIFASIHGLNKQVLHGADIMTRLEYAQRNGTQELELIGKTQILQLIQRLETQIKSPSNGVVVLAGNSAVTSFLARLDVEELAVSPYQPSTLQAQVIHWERYSIETLPLLYSFVGGDLFAGLFFLWEKEDALNEKGWKTPWILMDVGTNSEILYWDTEKLWISSTPAGPAFEGSSISIGMRAENGAITNPRWKSDADGNGRWEYQVIGGDLPKGICGSALIQAIYEAVESGAVAADGEVLKPEMLAFTEKLSLSQDDIREFQLAKSAIQTGLELINESGVKRAERLYLGGAFGEHLPLEESKMIGLLPEMETVALGNTSLKGTLAWANAPAEKREKFIAWLERVKSPLELALSDQFQEFFVKNMSLKRERPGE